MRSLQSAKRVGAIHELPLLQRALRGLRENLCIEIASLGKSKKVEIASLGSGRKKSSQ